MIRKLSLATAFVVTATTAIAMEWGEYGMASLRIAVKDEARSIQFYQLLGMKEGRLHHPGQQEMNWDKRSQGPGIVLMSAETDLVPGTANFIILVPDTHATAQALREAGFPDIGEPYETPVYTGLRVKDPDGNLIDLKGPLPDAR